MSKRILATAVAVVALSLTEGGGEDRTDARVPRIGAGENITAGVGHHRFHRLDGGVGPLRLVENVEDLNVTDDMNIGMDMNADMNMDVNATDMNAMDETANESADNTANFY